MILVEFKVLDPQSPDCGQVKQFNYDRAQGLITVMKRNESKPFELVDPRFDVIGGQLVSKPEPITTPAIHEPEPIEPEPTESEKPAKKGKK